MKNTFVKVLSFVMALTMIVSVFGAITVSAAEHTHTKGEVVKTVAPTCVKIGYTVYTCAECGEQYTDDVIMPSEKYHSVKASAAVEASCITNAFSAGQKCEYCSYVPEGSTRQEDFGTQKQHSFKQRQVAATCSAAARVEYVCTTCNLTAEQIETKRLEAVAAGLNDYAWVGTQTYAQYQKVVSTTDTATDPTHVKLTWEITVKPATGNATTLCAAGTAVGVCASCGLTKTATLPAPHEFDVADGAAKLNPTNSTCAEYKSGTACKFCKTPSPDAVKYTAEERTQHGVGTAIVKEFDGTVDATNLPTKNNGATITLATLRTFGLDTGSDMYTEPTCTATGLRLVECACGELFYKTVPATGHTVEDTAEAWDNITTINWAKLCTEDSVKVQKCANADCDYEITKVIQAKKNAAHPYTTTTVYPTCDAVGYKEDECKVTFTIKDGTETVTCGHKPARYDYVDATGHNLGSAVLKSGAKCDDSNGYIKKCQNVDKNNNNTACSYSEDTTKPSNAAHSYSGWTTVAGTCQEKSYQTKTCSKCGDVQKNPSFTGSTNANNHEYVHVGWESNVKPTCTTGAVEIIKCGVCTGDTLITRNVAANTNGTVDARHQYTAKYAEKVGNVLHVYGVTGTDTATVKYHALASTTVAKAATCQADGYKADGEYCAICGVAKSGKTATKITKESVQSDITAHTGTNTELASGSATCQARKWTKYNTTCCGIITIETGETVACSYVDVDFKAPTCTAAGNHAHQACKWCNAHKAGTTTTADCGLDCANHTAIDQKTSDNYVIAALGHSMKPQAAVAPVTTYVDDDPNKGVAKTSCENEGTAAYEYCERCKIRVFDGKTYDISNGTQKTNFENAIKVAPHFNKYKFTITAEEAAANPSTCSAYGKNAGTWCSVCDASKVEGVLDPWVDDTNYGDHSMVSFEINVKTGNKKYDCTKDSASVQTCKDCGYHTSTYTPAENPNGHDYNKYTVGTLTNQEWCEPYLKNPATEFHCTSATYKYKECKDCGEDVRRVEVVAEAAVGHKDAYGPISVNCDEISNNLGRTCSICTKKIDSSMVEHNYDTNTVKATCDKDGYVITFCRGCDNAPGNKTQVLPKLDANGKHTQGVVLEYVPASATVAGSVKYVCATANCGATVTEVIPATAVLVVAGAASAEMVTAGTDATYTVTFSGVAQTFKTIKLDVVYDASKFDFVGATSDLTNNVFASAYTQAGVDYVGVTLVKSADMVTDAEGTAVVTLTFTAKKYAAGDAKAFDVAEIDDAAVTVAATPVAVVGLGNPTGTGYVTGEDALAILDLDDSAEYNAAYDINGDGMIDAIDVILVGTFASSAQTAKDYLVMVGTYDEIAATISALYDDGLLADVNKDGNVNINDYYKLVTAVDAKLATYANYKAIDFASVEDLVMSVMLSLIA